MVYCALPETPFSEFWNKDSRHWQRGDCLNPPATGEIIVFNKFLSSQVAIVCLVLFVGFFTPSTHASDTDNTENKADKHKKDQSEEEMLKLPRCPPNCD